MKRPKSPQMYPIPSDPFGDLPSFRFTPTPATTREQTAQEDIAYGVRSLDDLQAEVSRRFKTPVKKASSKPLP